MTFIVIASHGRNRDFSTVGVPLSSLSSLPLRPSPPLPYPSVVLVNVNVNVRDVLTKAQVQRQCQTSLTSLSSPPLEVGPLNPAMGSGGAL